MKKKNAFLATVLGLASLAEACMFAFPKTMAAGAAGLGMAVCFYAALRMERYREAARYAMVCAACLILGVVLVVVSLPKRVQNISQGVQTIVADAGLKYYEVRIGEDRISLPMSVRDFQAMGFTLEEELDGRRINSKEVDYMGYDNPKYHTTSGMGNLEIWNPTDGPIDAEDGVIIYMTVYSTKWYDQSFETPDIVWTEGISRKSSLAEVKRALGEPVSETEDGLVYHMDNYETNYGDFLNFHFFGDGELSEVIMGHKTGAEEMVNSGNE